MGVLPCMRGGRLPGRLRVSLWRVQDAPLTCGCCREHAPSIIFMDEVDSIGSARSESGGGGGGGDSEVQRTMLELLNQLDGFEATNKIKVGPSLGPGAGALVLQQSAEAAVLPCKQADQAAKCLLHLAACTALQSTLWCAQAG